MENVKVIKVESDKLTFEDGVELYSEHDADCCETHFLSFEDLSIDDFDGLEFNFASDRFFKGIDEYGIELTPIKGHSVKIPGYGYNNGYYSSNLTLVIRTSEGFLKQFDISDCQDIKD